MERSTFQHTEPHTFHKQVLLENQDCEAAALRNQSVEGVASETFLERMGHNQGTLFVSFQIEQVGKC